jgi:hypothetical protein
MQYNTSHGRDIRRNYTENIWHRSTAIAIDCKDADFLRVQISVTDGTKPIGQTGKESRRTGYLLRCRRRMRFHETACRPRLDCKEYWITLMRSFCPRLTARSLIGSSACAAFHILIYLHADRPCAELLTLTVLSHSHNWMPSAIIAKVYSDYFTTGSVVQRYIIKFKTTVFSCLAGNSNNPSST